MAYQTLPRRGGRMSSPLRHARRGLQKRRLERRLERRMGSVPSSFDACRAMLDFVSGLAAWLMEKGCLHCSSSVWRLGAMSCVVLLIYSCSKTKEMRSGG
jgi:hypothetical protein